MKQFILLQFMRRTHYVLLSLIFFSACKKDATESNNQDDNNNQDPKTEYKFSAPQRISDIPASVYFEQRAFITKNRIYTRYISEVSAMGFNTGNSNIIFSFPETYSTSARAISGATGPYCVDKVEQYLYVVDNYSIYKCSLSNTANVTKIGSVGSAGCRILNIADNGDLYFATPLNGGSVQRIRSGASTAEIVADNLGTAPGALVFFENDIYITLDNLNGSVKKISSSGTVSTLMENLTHPSRLAFDNNGNLILETKTSLDGGDYSIYTLYKKSGTKIMDITDDQNNLILSSFGMGTVVPLFVDTNNNLFFGHNDYVSLSSINHSNPYIGTGASGYGNLNVYKIGLIKQ